MNNSQETVVQTYHADMIIDYIVCPAKAYINSHGDAERIPAREQVRRRLKKAVNDIAITMLGGAMPKNPIQLIETITEKVFLGIDYTKKAKDRTAISDLLMNFMYILIDKELKIDSLSREFDIAYEGAIIRSEVDLVLSDEKRGRKRPTILDFSNTAYEQFYNPVVYRCQMVVDFLELTQTTTDVLVLSLGSGKQWTYSKKTYGNLLYASICDTVSALKCELFPVRFGWWCSGCYWRGICHRIMTV